MIHIPEQEEGEDYVFASGMYFDATEKKRQRFSDLNAEEKSNLAFYLLKELEGMHGDAERMHERSAKILGWDATLE